MSRALYRKYRSKSLSEIVGQSHVTSVLSRALEQGKIAHAYLLTGPRGIGKTSIARILAHEINKLPYTDDSEHLDIIEIDAASNNGVDDVRDLRDKVQVAPSSAEKKVYIIDEVHMLSKPAFNALLKTLEEPPEHIVFILATTNVEKLPDTIISRTQRFSLRSITTTDAVKHLSDIANGENIKIDDEALEMIAMRGQGSFRDSISLLDQLSSLADTKEGITRELVESVLGLAPKDTIANILKSVAEHDPKHVLEILESAEQSGIQSSILIEQIIEQVRNDLINNPEYAELLDGLITAAESAKPELKLVTTLIHASTSKQKPTSAALVAQTATLSAPLEKLRKSATTLPIAKPAPTKVTAPKVVKVAEPTPIIESSRELVKANPDGLDWAALVEYTRANHVALHSVLSKCGYVLEGETLRLYTHRKFTKTKLDDVKYRTILADCLVATGAGDLTIETIPTAPPPSDETAAAVAAIMGGGEEVDVKE